MALLIWRKEEQKFRCCSLRENFKKRYEIPTLVARFYHYLTRVHRWETFISANHAHSSCLPSIDKDCTYLLESWTFCCPVLGTRHCTRAYCNRCPSPPVWQPSTTVQYGSGKIDSIWQKKLGPSSLFPSSCFIYGLHGMLAALQTK